MRKIIMILFGCSFLFTQGQVVYEDINNKGIYDFLDELANLKVIEINSVVKPYSRQFIAEKLVEAREYVSGSGFRVPGSKKDVQGLNKKRYVLNKRQVKELEFYLQDYQIDLRCEIPNNKNQKGSEVQKFKGSEDKDTLNSEPGTRNPERETRNPEPGTRNAKRETRNAKPGTRNANCEAITNTPKK